MSAFMVSHDTIRLIAIHATTRHSGGWDLDAAAQVAVDLYVANAKALADRYGDAIDMDDATTLSPADAMRLQRSPNYRGGGALKQIACYEYQACEWREFDGSGAQRACETARDKLIRALPGYEDAPWGLS
jgi:hypothetical protein